MLKLQNICKQTQRRIGGYAVPSPSPAYIYMVLLSHIQYNLKHRHIIHRQSHRLTNITASIRARDVANQLRKLHAYCKRISKTLNFENNSQHVLIGMHIFRIFDTQSNTNHFINLFVKLLIQSLMKKTLLSLCAVVAFGFSAAAEELTMDFTSNSYGYTYTTDGNYYEAADPTEITDGAITLSVSKNGGNGCRFWSADKTFRVYNKSITTISINGGTITSIAFTGSKLTALAADGFTGTASAKTWTGSASSIPFTASGSVTIKTITITYTGGTIDNRKDAGLAFSETSVTLRLNEEFTAPTLTKETTAAVTYASDATEVATVDATTGAVSIVGVGTARITATAEANDEYKAGSASYLITVKEAIPENALLYSELGEEFTFEQVEGTFEPWTHDSQYGLKGTGYSGGTNNATTAIAASPVIDLTNYESAQLTFKNAFNFYDDTIDGFAYVVVKEEGDDWVELATPTAPESFSWTFYDNEPISLADYDGMKIQIGFKYVSTTAVAGTWEVKNIVVTANAASSIDDMSADTDADAANAVYYNLQGARVDNPVNGQVYIRVINNKAEKVMF